MRLPEARTLFAKEWRELLASRAYLLLLIAVSLLVGHAFITAVETYAEMSGAAGGAAALSQGLSPLDGILVPTFGAYDLAATLLLPFVAIRLFAAERTDGAWGLLVQSPVSVRAMVMVKVAALVTAWAVAFIPGLCAVALWKFYGGHVAWTEFASLMFGHALLALLTIGISAAAAAFTTQSSAAAIVALGITVGSWALDFIGATRGGTVAEVARFTPAATLRLFEQGLVRANVLSVALVIAIAGIAVAVVWFEPGRGGANRARRTAAVLLAAVIVAGSAAQLRASWDATEDRRHSFGAAETAALMQLHGTLHVEIHLAPEDPRLTDLNHEVLAKLARVIPVDVIMVGDSRTGMFAARDSHYGEIWYEMNGRRTMERSSIEQIVLATIFNLNGVPGPAIENESAYSGYPNKSAPYGAAPLFFALFPLLTAGAFWYARRA